MSIVKANKWQNTSGVTYNSVLQVKQYVYNNPVVIGLGTAWTWGALPLDVSITPTKSTSVILFDAVYCIASQSGVSANSALRVRRKIGAGAYAIPSHTIPQYTGRHLTGHTLSFWGFGNNWSHNINCPVKFIDNPGTTSTVTYETSMGVSDGTCSYYFGYNYDSTTNSGQFGWAPAAIITLTEYDADSFTIDSAGT